MVGLGLGIPPIKQGGGAPAWVLAGAALDLDFAGNRLYGAAAFTDLLSCSRASTGYAETVAGTLTSFANNVLRRTDKGLLVEEARTNVLLRSHEFDNAGWSKTNVGVTANQATAPDGMLTAEAVVPTAGSAAHFLSQGTALTNGVTYSASVYAKANGYNWLQVRHNIGGGNHRAYFNLSNGTLGTVAADTTASIQALGNGWYRCTVVTVATSTATFNSTFVVTNADNVESFNADGVSGVYLWGAQLEVGAFPTSYIPTTTASAVRAADGVTFSNLSLFSTTLGSVVWNIIGVGGMASGGNYNGIFGFDTDSSSFITADIAYINQVEHRIRVAGATQFSYGTVVASTALRNVKGGVAFAANSVVSAVDGNASAEDNSATIPSFTSVKLGHSTWAVGRLNGYLKRFTYWPSRIGTATLVGHTV